MTLGFEFNNQRGKKYKKHIILLFVTNIFTSKCLERLDVKIWTYNVHSVRSCLE